MGTRQDVSLTTPRARVVVEALQATAHAKSSLFDPDLLAEHEEVPELDYEPRLSS